MAMTSSEREKCQLIIHSHAVAAAAGNAVPVPGLGVAVDTITMTTMAMALAAVFGGSITESVAKNMAINAIKKNMLKNPIKTVAKELSKIIPFGGQVVASSISVTMLESAGWVLAEELANKCGKLNVSNSNKVKSSNQSYSKIYFPSAEDSTEMICDKANKYYYGLDGYEMNRNRAFSLYKEAAAKGHSGAKNALKTLYNYNY